MVHTGSYGPYFSLSSKCTTIHLSKRYYPLYT